MSVPHRVAADAAATVSVATASASWLASLNGWLQLIATTVAIAAGCIAIAVHWRNLKK